MAMIARPTGTATICGEDFTWTSPTLGDLDHFESTVGPVSDPTVVNSVKGRIGLAHICLKEHHPDLLPGVIRTWPAQAFREIWPMLMQAVPLWAPASPPETEPAVSPDSSSSPSSDAPDGSLTAPDVSA